MLAGPLAAGVLVLALASCASPPPRPQASAGADLDAVARTHPVAFLDRIGWGADAAQLESLRRLGAVRFLDAQLEPQPEPTLPPSVQEQLAALQIDQPLETLIPPFVERERALRMAKRDALSTAATPQEQQFKAINQHRNDLVEQAATRQLLLAVYSPNQLQERLTWFWMNHFNVFREGNIAPMMGDYYARVIKPHALGHFGDLLQATMFSPQMLLYLNNAQSTRGHLNENYAREIMELHTLGVGNGYTQADVTELAGVLTGLGVNLVNHEVHVRPALQNAVWARGLVLFNPALHDPSPKRILGRTLQGQGVDEIEQVVDLLAEDPATARHVCGQLAQYFVGDRPPPALVDAMARRWAATHGDIAAVLRTLFMSPQFAQSLLQPQFKDPMRYVLSAARASFDGRTIVNARPLLGMLGRLGEPLYGRQTPDGYPMVSDAWDGPGQMTARFEVARQFAAGAPALFVRAEPAPPPAMDGAMMAPAGGRMAMAAPAPTSAALRPQPPVLVQTPVFLTSEPLLSETTRHTLAQADNRVMWNALWLSSPEFMNQ